MTIEEIDKLYEDNQLRRTVHSLHGIARTAFLRKDGELIAIECPSGIILSKEDLKKINSQSYGRTKWSINFKDICISFDRSGAILDTY